jgi:hypothetical protein
MDDDEVLWGAATAPPDVVSDKGSPNGSRASSLQGGNDLQDRNSEEKGSQTRDVQQEVHDQCASFRSHDAHERHANHRAKR